MVVVWVLAPDLRICHFFKPIEHVFVLFYLQTREHLLVSLYKCKEVSLFVLQALKGFTLLSSCVFHVIKKTFHEESLSLYLLRDDILVHRVNTILISYETSLLVKAMLDRATLA